MMHTTADRKKNIFKLAQVRFVRHHVSRYGHHKQSWCILRYSAIYDTMLFRWSAFPPTGDVIIVLMPPPPAWKRRANNAPHNVKN